MADQALTESKSGKADSLPSKWLAWLKRLKDENPWIGILFILVLLLEAITKILNFLEAIKKAPDNLPNVPHAATMAKHFLPKVPHAAMIVAGWIAAGILRIEVFIGAFAACIFEFLMIGTVLLALARLLYWALFVLTFGRIRHFKIELPEWVGNVAAGIFWCLLILGLSASALFETVRAQGEDAQTFAFFGILILILIGWLFLRAYFPPFDRRVRLAFDKLKELRGSVEASNPVSQISFALFWPAVLFSLFFLWHVFQPWYMSDRRNTVLGGLAALSCAVLLHTFVKRSKAWETSPDLRSFGTFLILAASVGMWIFVWLFDFSPFPTEPRLILRLELHSNRPLNRQEWAKLPLESSAMHKYRPFLIHTFHSLCEQQSSDITAKLALGNLRIQVDPWRYSHDKLEDPKETCNLRDALMDSAHKPADPFDWEAVGWEEYSGDYLLDLYSTEMQFRKRQGKVAELVKQLPLSGTISWAAPEDICGPTGSCIMDPHDEASLPAIVKQMLKDENATPVGALGSATLDALGLPDTEAAKIGSEGKVLLVEQDRKLRVMAFVW